MRRFIRGIKLGAGGAVLILILAGCGGGGGGGSSSSSGTTTSANSAPAAGFTVSAASGKTPLAVTFDASGSTDSDGTIASYAWSFGDGGTGSGVSVAHTYDTVGTYTAQLTVTDNGGLTASTTCQITVTGYTLSGSVTAASHIADSDVNVPEASRTSNNSFAEAQEIVSPVTVSGYVNVAGAGPRGASYSSGDTNDYFKIPLSRGMAINLYMSEAPAASKLNLYLYDSGGSLVNYTPTNSGGVASLESTADGVYYVRVEAVSSGSIKTASGYALTVGLSGMAAGENAIRLSDDFVPGEVLVRFEGGATALGASQDSSATPMAKAAALGFADKSGNTGRDRLLKQADAVARDTLFDHLGVRAALESSLSVGKMDANSKAKMETLWMAQALQKQEGVLYAEPNYIRKSLAVPDDPYYATQWHYPLIHLPEAWDITTGSSSVTVAVVDTGVLLSHPDFVNTDLSSQLVAGYDFISSTSISQDGDGVDSNPDDPGDGDVGGSSFHGTHVAGTIAAASNNKIGVAGVAWNARIMPLRVLGKGGGTSYDIIQAVKYAAGLDTDYSGVKLAKPVDIINLSLGGTGYSATEAAVYQEARAKGVIIVAAAGNSANSSPMYPAAYPGVVSVSAVTIGEALASYSNYGSTIDVAAPGGSSTDENGDGNADGVLSTVGDDSSGAITMGYAFYMGTSMAAPHVAGVAALMKAKSPTLTPDSFDALLQAGYLTRDLGVSGRDDKFGYGLIDAYKAVLAVTSGIPAVLTASPSNIDMGRDLAVAEITLKNSGNTGTVLTVGTITSDSAWLSVSATSVDAAGLGTYRVAVSRTGLADGVYSGKLSFSSSANKADVTVTLQVGTAAGVADGGYHYILLVNPDTLDTVRQVAGAGVNGVYPYSFSGLSYGSTYFLYAGTDPNNDYYICDKGEACGAYLSLDQPVEVTVTGNMTGVDFTTGVNISLSNAASSRFAGTEMPLQRQLLREVLP